MLATAVCRAFHISEAPPWDPPRAPLSYGNAEDFRTSRVLDLTIFDPAQEESKTAGLWATHLDSLRDRGWRVAYTDGSGAEGIHAAGVTSEGPCGWAGKSYGEFLGEEASVAGAERLGLTLALEREHPEQPLALASDSRAAIATLRALSRGASPRSDIEIRQKDALERRTGEVGAL